MSYVFVGEISNLPEIQVQAFWLQSLVLLVPLFAAPYKRKVLLDILL